MRWFSVFIAFMIVLLIFSPIGLSQTGSLRNVVSTSSEYQKYIAQMAEVGKYIEEGNEVKELVPGGKRKAVEIILGSTGYLDTIIKALEEFAGYFAFWEANFYAEINNPDKVEKTLQSIAKKYKEVKAGEIAQEILKSGDNKDKLSELVIKRFKELNNPMNISAEERNAPADSIKNKLRVYIGKSKVYRDWQGYDEMLDKAKKKVEIKSLLKQSSMSSKIEGTLKALLKSFDEEIAWRFVEKAGDFLSVSLDPSYPKRGEYLEQAKNCYQAAAERFPETRAGEFAKTAIESWKSEENRKK